MLSQSARPRSPHRRQMTTYHLKAAPTNQHQSRLGRVVGCQDIVDGGKGSTTASKHEDGEKCEVNGWRGAIKEAAIAVAVEPRGPFLAARVVGPTPGPGET